MYHALVACAAHVPRWSGLRWARTFVLGGAIGVRLKLYRLCSCSHAESLELILEPCMRFRVSSDCGMVRSHRCMGKLLSMLAHPAVMWFLAVQMACSVALAQWSCGAVSWT